MRTPQSKPDVYEEIFLLSETSDLVVVRGTYLLRQALEQNGFSHIPCGLCFQGLLSRPKNMVDRVVCHVGRKHKRPVHMHGSNGYDAFIGGHINSSPYRSIESMVYHHPSASLVTLAKRNKLDAPVEKNAFLYMHLTSFGSEREHQTRVDLITELFFREFDVQFPETTVPLNFYI